MSDINPVPSDKTEKIADKVATVMTVIIFAVIAMIPLTGIVLLVKYVWFG